MYFNHILDSIVAYSLQQLYLDMWFTFYLPTRTLKNSLKLWMRHFFLCVKNLQFNCLRSLFVEIPILSWSIYTFLYTTVDYLPTPNSYGKERNRKQKLIEDGRILWQHNICICISWRKIWVGKKHYLPTFFVGFWGNDIAQSRYVCNEVR